MSTTPTNDQVIVVDLRGVSRADTKDLIAAATLRAMTVRESRPAPHTPPPSQYLVIDSHAEVDRHAEAYSQILVGGAEQVSLLCLVIGSAEPAAHGEPQPLTRPSLLRGSSVAMIWIGDVTGQAVGSGMWTQPDTNDEATALAVLVDILARDNVFAETMRLIGELPQQVAAMSIRAVRYELAPDQLRDAQNRALNALSGEQGDPAAADDAVIDPPDWLVGMLEPGKGRTRTAPLAAGGRLDEARNECLSRLEQAQSGAARLRRAATLLHGDDVLGPEQIGDVGTALRQYQAKVIDALADDDLTFGLPVQRAEAMAEHGLALSPGPPAADQPVEDLLAYALALLRAGWPLRGVSEQLRGQAALLTPAGSANRVRVAEERCQPELIARLTDPPPFDVGASRWSRLGATALAGLAGTLWPIAGAVPGLLVVALAVAGTSRAHAARPGRNRPAADGSWYRQAVAGVVGVGLGALIGTGIVTPRPPVWVAAAGLVAALVLVVTVTVRHWQRSVDQWLARTALAAADEAVGGLDQVVSEAAAQDWWQSDRRIRVADLLSMLADLFTQSDDAVRGLEPAPARRTQTGRHNATGLVPVQRDPAWLVRQRRRVGRGLDGAVRRQLIGVLSTALDEACGTVETQADDLTEIDYQQFGHGLQSELAAELQQVGESLMDGYDSAVGPDRHPGRTEVSRPTDHLDDPVPLIDRGQRLLLARDPNRIREIRMVPPTAQPELARSVAWRAPFHGTWLDTPGYLGLMRLQPFQAGAVATVRPRITGRDEES